MLIVSDDVFNSREHYPKVLVVHLTSVRRPGGPYDWEVDVPRGAAGLGRPGIVKCGEVYTFWKDQLESLAGTMPGRLMTRVDRALAIALGLPTKGPGATDA